MFYYCISLTVAPELPAPTLTTECYESMFKFCSNLTYVKVGFTDWNASATGLWLKEVASNGLFICPEELPIQHDGKDGNYIPVGWTVEKY